MSLLVTLAFSTMLRRSELVALEVADFKPTPDAQDGTIRVRSSKADQAGHGAERYVSPEARRHLEAWLDAAALHEGPVFVRLNRNGGDWKSPQMPATYLRGQRARSGGHGAVVSGASPPEHSEVVRWSTPD